MASIPSGSPRHSGVKSAESFALSGVVDISRSAEVRDLAQRCVNVSRDVTVDCRDLERLDSAGLQVLLALRVTLAKSGGEVRLLGLSSAVRSYLKIAGALGYFSLLEGEVIQGQPEEHGALPGPPQAHLPQNLHETQNDSNQPL